MKLFFFYFFSFIDASLTTHTRTHTRTHTDTHKCSNQRHGYLRFPRYSHTHCNRVLLLSFVDASRSVRKRRRLGIPPLMQFFRGRSTAARIDSVPPRLDRDLR
uniref:Putative secreted protein n=1 Tax=Anopheles darlingi TaxID=43151 RepID=A0A2M4D490_ANODA